MEVEGKKWEKTLSRQNGRFAGVCSPNTAQRKPGETVSLEEIKGMKRGCWASNAGSKGDLVETGKRVDFEKKRRRKISSTRRVTRVA